MQLDNLSPWAATLTPGWGKNRQMQMTCTIKMGFSWDNNGQLQPLSEDECPLVFSDEYLNDDPENASVIAVNDTVPFKQGFEWLLTGSVYPIHGVTHQALRVSFVHGAKQKNKTIFALGPRQWKKSLFGVVPDKPTQVQAMPIQYEQAFGGLFEDDNGKVTQYDANPIGIGYYAAGSKEGDLQMPCFEYEPFIKGPKEKPTPAGFGAISATWAPRLEKFSALDATAAAEGQCPYPQNISADLFNSAPQDQRFEALPPQNTELVLEGFSEKNQRIKLPNNLENRIRLRLKKYHQVYIVNAECDTLLIDTDKQTIAWLWRAGIPWNPLETEVSQLLLDEVLDEAVFDKQDNMLSKVAEQERA